MSTIAAGAFQARCLELLDEVARTRDEIIITKYGRPVAKLVPLKGTPTRPLFGRARHTVVNVADDTFAATPELWSELEG